MAEKPETVDWKRVKVEGGVMLTSEERKVLDEVVEKYMSNHRFGQEFVAHALELDARRDSDFLTPEVVALVGLYVRVAFTQWFAAVISNRVPYPGSLAVVRSRLLKIEAFGFTKPAQNPYHDVTHALAAFRRNFHNKKRRAQAVDTIPAFTKSTAPGTLFATFGNIIGLRGPTGADHDREEILSKAYNWSKAYTYAKQSNTVAEFIVACTKGFSDTLNMFQPRRYTSRSGSNAWFYAAMSELYVAFRSGASREDGQRAVARAAFSDMERYLRDVVPDITIPQWRS